MRKTIFILIGSVLIILAFYNFLPFSSGEFVIMHTRSMEPTIKEGEVVRLDRFVSGIDIHADFKNANPPGDIIAFQSGNNITIHRVVEKIQEANGKYTFETWGDANSTPDINKIHEDLILGKVVQIYPSFGINPLLLWSILLVLGVILLIIGTFFSDPKKID